MRYRLTYLEIFRFTIFALLRSVKRAVPYSVQKLLKGIAIFFLVICVLGFMTVSSVAEMVEYNALLLDAAWSVGSCWLLLLFIAAAPFYLRCLHSGMREETELVLEQDVLKIKGRFPTEWKVSQISVIKETKSLLILGRDDIFKAEAFLVIPKRVFGDLRQKEQWLAALKGELPKEEYTAFTDKETAVREKPAEVREVAGNAEKTAYEVSFLVNTESFAGFLTELTDWRLASGNASPLKGILWYILSCIGVLYFTKQAGTSGLFACLILFLLGERFFCTYLKPYKTHFSLWIRLSKSYRSVLGRWSIRFHEEHFLVSQNGIEHTYAWNQFGGIAERSHSYLMYSTDGKGIFFLPKSALTGELREEVLRLCRLHGEVSSWKQAEQSTGWMNIVLFLLLQICILWNLFQ